MKEKYNSELKKLTQFQSQIDVFLTKLSHNMNSELKEYIKTSVSKTSSFFGQEKDFKLELVVDTNIIFSEVRSLCVNNSSFLLKIINNPFIKVYAPSKLKEELYSKIKIKFPKDKKTKKLEINDCLKKADFIISKLTINDNISKFSMAKATSIIGVRDKDDIPFLALNISINSHGIITKDRDLSDQKEIKTWDLKDTGKVLTEISKGTFSFLILDFSIQKVIDIISDIVCIIWSRFLTIINNILKFFINFLLGSIEKVSDIPSEYLISFSILIILWKDLRNNISNFLEIIWSSLLKILSKIKELFLKIWDSIQHLANELLPLLSATSEFLIYLTHQSKLTKEQIEKLELERAY